MSQQLSTAPHPSMVFNRRRVNQHRDRAAKTFAQSAFLFDEGAKRLADRLPDIIYKFPVALDLGSHNGLLAGYLPTASGIEKLVQVDMSQAMVKQARGLRVVADEEWLPFAEHSFDLVMSVFSLHWVNDLPGTLIQIHRILKPGGLLLAMVPGGHTLKELRESFEQAEMAAAGGVSPRISPFIDARDGAGLLQRAGFTMPVADSDMLTVQYEDPMELLDDLRSTGESNALATSQKGLMRRSVLYDACDYYQRHFASHDGRVNATFEIVALTGWKENAGSASN